MVVVILAVHMLYCVLLFDFSQKGGCDGGASGRGELNFSRDAIQTSTAAGEGFCCGSTSN